jgi:carboxymethylenebutenolidase
MFYIRGGAMKLNRMILFSFLFLFFPGSVFADDMRVKTDDVVYYNNGKDVRGYLATPGDNKKHPGMILIHEWWGLNDYIRQNAIAFAKLGYVALTIDLYGGKPAATNPQDARKLAGSVRNNVDEALRNLKSAVSYMKNRSDVYPDRMASIGWCFGGGWSYQIAKNNLGTKASIIYYGRFNPKDDLSKMRATILGNFGAEDRGIMVDTVYEFQAKLKTLNGDHEIYIYENAGHGFANEGGRAYNKEATDLAWKRTVAFLKKYL